MEAIEETAAGGREASPTLADAILALYGPGTAVYANRTAKGGYEPAVHPQTTAKLPLDRQAVEKHLANVQPIGVYPIAPGANFCHFGVLDFDDHDGNTGWETTKAKALEVSHRLEEENLHCVAFRSGGGRGIHLVTPFTGPVDAAGLRAKLRSVLATCALKNGTEGVGQGEVEIFPKQDRVDKDKVGNLIALPLARRSVLLDANMEEFKGDVLARLLQTTRVPATRISKVHENTHAAAAPSTNVEGELTDPDAHPLFQCSFLQHCRDQASAISEPLWFAAASSAAYATQGRAFFHHLSRRDGKRYDAAETDKKFDHARTLLPYSCAKVAELGYRCEKMNDDGSCSVTAGTNPAAFATPINLQVEVLRRTKPVDVRNRRIAKVVRTRLEAEGSFFVAGTDSALLYFSKQEKRLYRVDSDQFAAFLCDKFGLNRAEQEFKFVLADLETYALRHGRKQHVHRTAYFSGSALYVDAGAQQMYRIDGKTITQLFNGDDGVLFRDSDRIQPFSFNPDLGTGHVRKYLVGQLHTADADSRDLFEAYIYTLFFERLLPTKPIALINGPKGSGKSFAGRAIKKALYGGRADVDIGVTKDERTAAAVFSHNYFICMDNADGAVDWLANILASVSTGTVIRMATLYKTNEESEFEPHCFVMMNSRDPASVKRDDIADRLLIFEVERHSAFIPESQLLTELAQNRAAILSEIFLNLKKIVAKINRAKPEPAVGQRLADFAALAKTVSGVLHRPGAVRALAKMDDKRNDFVLDGEPINAALLSYTLNPDRPEWIATGALFESLKGYGDFGRMTARSFGRKLKNLESNMREQITMEWRPAGQGIKEVKITATEKGRAILTDKFQRPAKVAVKE